MQARKSWLVGASILALAAGLAPFQLGPLGAAGAWAQSGESGESGSSEGGDGDEGGEGAEGGESSESGESGEGGEAGTADTAALLSMAQGHLLVSLELYRAGERTLTKDHAAHPEKELFPALDHAVSELGESGLLDKIEAYEHAVEDENPLDEVEAAYEAVDQEIDRLRLIAAPDAKSALASVAVLLRQAGHEYAEGVQGGKVVNQHEYADARGFVLAARDMLNQLSPEARGAAKDVVASVESDLGALDPLWPSLDALAVDGDAAKLHGAAAKAEIAVGKIE